MFGPLYYSDRPADIDALGFSDFRPGLVEIITRGETPLTIGVFGRWGSGKTSLLRMLKNDVERISGEKVRTVWFTAWKYNHREALWRALILRVLDAFYPRKDEEKPWEERGRKSPEEMSKEEKERVEQLARLAQSLYGPVEWTELGSWKLDWTELGGALAKVPALLAFLLTGGPVGSKFAQMLGINPDLAEAVRREVHIHRMAHISSMEQFEDAFRKVITSALGDEGRLVVFVDDLDRCLPEKAVEVLEAIKLFLEVENTVFVLGLDRDIIRIGIEEYYRSRGSTAPIEGTDYLEKIIQIPFYLPPLSPENVSTFLRFLKGEHPEEPPIEDFIKYLNHPAVEREISDLVLKIFAKGLAPNPRQFKRALNTFRLLQSIALVREKRGSLPPGTAWPLLAKIVVLQIQHDNIYRQWLRPGYLMLLPALEISFESNKPLEKASKGLPPSISEKLKEIFQNEEQVLQLRGLLTYPPPEERRGGRWRTHFGQLRDEELEAYRSLSAPMALEEALAELLSPLGEALATGDVTQLWPAAARIRRITPEETERALWLLDRAEHIRPDILDGAKKILMDKTPLQFLASKFDDEDEGVFRAAVKATSALGTSQAIRLLVSKFLGEENPERRKVFMEALRFTETTSTIEYLLTGLKGKDSEVHNRAIEGLVKIGKPAVESLIKRLDAEDAEIRNGVIEALSKMGESVVEPLIERLGDKDIIVQKGVIEVLVRIGEPAVKLLIEALRYEDDVVRNRAMEVISKIGQPAISLLVERLGDEDTRVQEGAVEALVRIGEVAVEPLVKALRDKRTRVREGAIKALVMIGGAAVEPLIDSLRDENALVRSGAMKALIEIREVAVNPLIKRLRDEDAETRERIKEVLIKIRERSKDEEAQGRRGAKELLNGKDAVELPIKRKKEVDILDIIEKALWYLIDDEVPLP